MESITLGQLAAGIAFIVALIGGVRYLANFITEQMKAAIKTEIAPIKDSLNDMKSDISSLKEDTDMLKKTTYTTLSHLATKNNTKEMQAALDEYISSAMHVK